ncbi:MAG: hypothetical protein HFF72_00705 [Oscillospiraceae bacterium]|jgi:hypothetical protein|nr:hypothetical protein [Oscillospiraceae bacterium]MCI8941395.1 hypothetical protein [Oscillospiraceae bacterium]
MEDKRLKRVFDQVKLSREREEAMLADLLNEKKEVSGMKQMNRRRIPAAAFVAAVLVIALAGTALAYFSRVTVAPYGDEGGYSVRAETGNVPLSELSEDVLQRAAEASVSGELLPFQSWEEAEEYLGLDIADNARLEQMEKSMRAMSLGEDDSPVLAPCLLLLWYYGSGRPDTIDLSACYEEGDYAVNVEAVLLVEDPDFDWERSYHFANAGAEMSGAEQYVTPGGLETTIVTSRETFREDAVFTKCEAEFVLGRASFRVWISVPDGDSVEGPESLLKEVLDAYR